MQIPAPSDTRNTEVPFGDGGGLATDALQRFLYEIRDEPLWRREADRACEYYDGYQLDSKILNEMADRGIPPLIRNLIGPTVDLVLGLEAKQRRDCRVIAEQDEDADVADVLALKLKQASHQARLPKAISEAYSGQIKAGLGWVEVQKEADPFKPKYRVAFVHRREMFWDWRTPDPSQWRYLVRRQWKDKDMLQAFFPDWADVIEQCANGWAGWDSGLWRSGSINLLAKARDDELRWTMEAIEWRDTQRKRLVLYEVWYRLFAQGFVLRLPNDLCVEYNPQSPQHQLAVASGVVVPERATIPKVRLSWWLGPHRLADIASPCPHNQFPYIPFFGYREDNTGVPYGLIRRMMSPQDEVNARLSKMMWLLSAKRVIADDDALSHTMTMQQLRNIVARPDAIILTNPNRINRNADAIRIDADREMSSQQFNVLKDSTESIQNTAGVYQQMLGKDPNAQSGVAIANLVEQGATTLAEINDNYHNGVIAVHELLLAHVRHDLGQGEQTHVIDRNGRKLPVTVNQRMTDPAWGFEYVSNDLQQTRTKLELEEIAQTPSFRRQIFSELVELTKNVDPQIRNAILDIIIDASDLPNRKQVAARISEVTGFGNDGSPEAKAAAQARAEQSRLANETAQAQLDKLKAEIDKLRADGTEQNIKALYDALQTAGILVTVPGTAEVADQLLKSGGYVDHDAPPIVAEPAPGLQPPAIPQQPHTHPDQPMPPASPSVGLEHGIETPTLGDQ